MGLFDIFRKPKGTDDNERTLVMKKDKTVLTPQEIEEVRNRKMGMEHFEGNFAPAKDMTGAIMGSPSKEETLKKMQQNRAKAAAMGDQQTADAVRRSIVAMKSQN